MNICSYAEAADISALNFYGDLLGKVIPDGSVVNADNELIGRITADGFVLDNQNELVGGIVPNGIAVSYNNSILGKVNNDGSVTSLNDNLVGKVLPNGLVVNDNYDILGAVVSPGLVYDDRGRIVGRVAGDGKFYNLPGENAGFVTASGYVYTLQGAEKKITLAGKLITSKIVTTANGRFLGSITPDGKVIDLKKNIIGNIHANGFVYDKENIAIGQTVKNGYAFGTDGTYLGVVAYNGDVINRGEKIGTAVLGGRVTNKEGEVIGFSVNMDATANDLKGKYLGRLGDNGNIFKGRNIVGRIGASGNVIDNTGKVIGIINKTGPVFDYLGTLKANAAINGKVVSLEGVEQGYLQGNTAFDRNGKIIGKTNENRLNFDNGNNFIGISGINSRFENEGKTYITAPTGYVFNEKGELAGYNFAFADIIAPNGNTLSYTSADGKSENKSLNEIARLTGYGFFIDKNNKPLGAVSKAGYVTDFFGNSVGTLNRENLVINDKNNIFAKVLPEGNVISSNGKLLQNNARFSGADVSVYINGDYLGVNNLLGQVNNADSQVGKISSGKYVVDNMGALLGTVVAYGAIISPKCEFLGVVSDTGEARTTKDAYLGMILANGQVAGETEEIIGYVVSPHIVNGQNGNNIGFLTPAGTALNYNNQNLGCVDVNGFVRNAEKEIVGQAIPYVKVMGFDNKIVGYTNFSGNIADLSGKQLAMVGLDGNINNAAGENVGVLFRYTVAFDENNIYLGRVTPEGTVIADDGKTLGTVNYNGQVITKNGQKGFALFDLYAYDDKGNTIGYISKNGRVHSIMGDVKGRIYQGFVLDKKQNLIGRGSRDYYIRNNNGQVIGFLNLDGSVTDIKNIEIGRLDENNGDIIDAGGDIIAKADPLQYYHRISEIKNVPEIAQKSEIEQEPEKTTEPETETDTENQNNSEEQEKETPFMLGDDQPYIVGIAISPDGQYLGDVYSDTSVKGKDGENIGTHKQDGSIVDKDGKTIGRFDGKKASGASRAPSAKWYHEQMTKGVVVDPYSIGNSPTNVGPGGGIGPGGRYNPQRAAILAQMHEERRQGMQAVVISSDYDPSGRDGWDNDWGIMRSVSSLRVDMRNMITEDKPIPAVLARSVISLGEAPVTAIVERNIYGDSGRNVIIPAGSRVIGRLEDGDGEGNSRFDRSSGGVKLEIEWTRIIRPDGIAFVLNRLPLTGDAQGRGGGALGYVDEQLVKKYTLPIISTLAASAVTYMIAADEDSTGEVETSKQQAASDAREQFMNKMDEILQEIIESKEQIVPVTYVPAGTRIIIYPQTDLWLRTAKDIDRGIKTTYSTESRGGDPLIDESAENNEYNNSQGGGRQTVLGNKAPNNNNAPNNGGTSLISEEPAAQNQNAQRKNSALPPPAADGSGMNMPEEESSDDGDLWDENEDWMSE